MDDIEAALRDCLSRAPEPITAVDLKKMIADALSPKVVSVEAGDDRSLKVTISDPLGLLHRAGLSQETE